MQTTNGSADEAVRFGRKSKPHQNFQKNKSNQKEKKVKVLIKTNPDSRPPSRWGKHHMTMMHNTKAVKAIIIVAIMVIIVSVGFVIIH
jgi:hypothetical protein